MNINEDMRMRRVREQKLAQARVEARRIEARAKAKAAVSKPAGPDIWDRILDRLEKQHPERTGFTKTADPKAYYMSALDQWKAAVASHRLQGMDGRRAVAMADRENPGLREQMLAEVNQGR